MTESLAVLNIDDDGARTRPGTIGNRVFDAVRQAIVQLQLRPGNSLSEADLARQLGVSRQPVREAFIRLTAEGLQASGPITLRTSNARLEAHQIEAGEALTLRTSNGKIVFSELNGTGITMHTSNATVDGSLPHAANHYSVTSATSNGSNTLKHHAHQGPVPLDVRTSNSAIRVSFTDNA